MAGIRLGPVSIPLTGSARGFNRAARSAADSTRQLERRQRALRSQLNRNRQAFKTTIIALGSLRSAFATVVAATGVGAVSKFLANTSKAVSELQNFADQAGLTTTTLQALQRAGGDWNIEAAQINQAMTRFTRVIGEADQGLATYKRIFDQLGISIRDSRGELRSSEVVFEEFAQRLQGVGSASERNALLMQAFGRQGARLGLLFDRVGREGLSAFNESQKRLGILTESQVRRQQELNRAINAFGDVLTYQGRAMASAVSSEWTEMIKSMSESAPAIANLLEPALRGIVSIASGVVQGLGGIATGLNDILVKIGVLYSAEDRFGRLRDTAEELERAINRGARGSGAVPGLAGSVAAQLQEFRADGIEVPVGVVPKAVLDSTQFQAATRKYWKERLDEAVKYTEEQNRAAIKAAQARKKAEEEIAAAAAKAIQRTNEQAQDITLQSYRRSAGAMWRGATTGPEYDAWVKRQEAAAASAADAAATRWSEVFQSRMARSRNMFADAGRGIINRAGFGGVSLDAAVANTEQSRRAAAGAGQLTAQQQEQLANIARAAELANNAVIKLSAQTRERLAPVFAGLNNQLSSFFDSIISGTASASDAFKSLAADIARAVAQALIIQPLVNSITGGAASFFGIPTGRAQGGAAYAGQSYLVGELGPERFVPAQSGRIVANKDMARGVNVTINNSFKLFDDTGFEERMIPIGAQIKDEAMRGVFDALRRPGVTTENG